jgi:hypothetical protein
MGTLGLYRRSSQKRSMHRMGGGSITVQTAVREVRLGFFEARRHLYNLYPLLVHVYFFGGGYVRRVDDTLRSFGF